MGELFLSTDFYLIYKIKTVQFESYLIGENYFLKMNSNRARDIESSFTEINKYTRARESTRQSS